MYPHVPRCQKPRWLKYMLGMGVGLALSTDVRASQMPNPESAPSDAITTERELIEAGEDGTVAEAIERRPDLSFANVTLDGESSTISLSDLSADSISSLEVLRAVTPEMDADARGGSLSLRSKPAFEMESSNTSAQWGFTHLPEWDRTWHAWAFNHARSLGPVGIRLNAAYENGEWGESSYFADWGGSETGEEASLQQAGLSTELTESSEWSAGGSLDWKISAPFYLFLRANTAREDESKYRPVLRYNRDVTDSISREISAYDSKWRESSITLGGFYDGDLWEVDFRFLAKNSRYLEPDYFTLVFRRDEIDLSHAFDAAHFPVFTDQTGFDDAAAYRFEELGSQRWEQICGEWIGAFNVKHRTRLLEGDTVIKMGGKWHRRELDQSTDTRIFTDLDEDRANDLVLAEVLSSYARNGLIGGRYDHGPFPSVGATRTVFTENAAPFYFNEDRTRGDSDPATYDVSESVPAIYGMVDWERGRFRILAGLRGEETQLAFQANEVVFDAEGNYLETNPLSSTTRYTNLFPGLHVRYFWGSRTTIITSWTRTIKRGDYKEVVPYRSIDYKNRSISEGNPNLRPTRYSNFDFAIDYKLSETSLLALDLSHREVSDDVFSEEITLTEGPFVGFHRTGLRNGPSATISSAKVTWKQDLHDWWGELDGLSYNLNATVQQSETETPHRPGESFEVSYTPAFKMQAVLNYTRKAFFIQFNYNYTSEQLDTISTYPWRDRYRQPRHDLDVDISYSLSDRWRIRGEIDNLLDQSVEEYFGTDSRIVNHDRNPRTFTLILRWEG